MGELRSDADGPFGLVMIGAFRLAMGRMSGWQSPLRYVGGERGESYRGLVEVSRRLFASSREETVDRVVGVLRQFPTQPQLLGDNRPSAELLGVLTPPLFRFLVGPSKTEAWAHPSGKEWRSRVVIEQCRFLTSSGCKGMCVGLCKQPTERFFNDKLGLPLSMEPNFDDGSCTMTWGERPLADSMAESDLRCFKECTLSRTRKPGESCEIVDNYRDALPAEASAPTGLPRPRLDARPSAVVP
jgi:hypothetical protein